MSLGKSFNLTEAKFPQPWSGIELSLTQRGREHRMLLDASTELSQARQISEKRKEVLSLQPHMAMAGTNCINLVLSRGDKIQLRKPCMRDYEGPEGKKI